MSAATAEYAQSEKAWDEVLHEVEQMSKDTKIDPERAAQSVWEAIASPAPRYPGDDTVLIDLDGLQEAYDNYLTDLNNCMAAHPARRR